MFFRELRLGALRRIPLLGNSVNRPSGMRWTPCDGIMDFRDPHEDCRIRPKLPRLSLCHRQTWDTYGFHGVVDGCPPSPARFFSSSRSPLSASRPHPGDYQTLTGSVSRREGMYPMASRPASLSSR